MEIRQTALPGVFIFEPRVFADTRGFLTETYNEARYRELGLTDRFVQDNHSRSLRGVVRGLHYQQPNPQGKLVQALRGRIFDVAVDIRRGSPDFGKWVALEVSAEKWNQIVVPKGFAHGFVTLQADTEVIYKVTDTYSAEHDRSIRFDDPDIGIEWPLPAASLILSEKDRNAPPLRLAETFE